MKRALAVTVVAACGRVGFDPLASPTGSDAAGSADGATGSGGLVAWYTLDEASGTIVDDSSGAGNNAYTDACGSTFPAWTSGHFGGALQFDASATDCVAVNSEGTLRIPGAWTVTAWVAANSLPPTGDAFAVVVKPNAVSEHNYALWIDHGYIGASNLGFAVSFTDATEIEHAAAVTYTIVPNQAYFLAGMWDGTRLTMFIDGAAAASTTPGADPAATPASSQFPLLGKNECCAQYLDGILDDVRIYNRALSSQEIATLFTVP